MESVWQLVNNHIYELRLDPSANTSHHSLHLALCGGSSVHLIDSLAGFRICFQHTAGVGFQQLQKSDGTGTVSVDIDPAPVDAGIAGNKLFDRLLKRIPDRR